MDNLISLYKQRLNLQNATFTPIDHDEAMVAIVYKITGPMGLPLILKISTRTEDYLRELYFLKRFAGKLPVPGIVQEVPPQAGIHGAILMECLPGTLLKIIDLTDELAYEIGSQLATIHLSRVTGMGRALATIGFIIKQDTWANRHAPLYQVHRQFLDNFFTNKTPRKN